MKRVSVFILLAFLATVSVVFAQSYGGSGYTRISSTSATTCTHLIGAQSRGVKIINTGPATTVFPTFYDETGSACATATTIYGDGATVTLGTGQVITLDIPVSGLSYKLSGAIAASDFIIITTL